MRWVLFMAAGIALGSLTGCVATSLYPLCDGEQDMVRDDRLAGTWANGEVRWTVWRAGAAYVAQRDEADTRAAFRISLTRIGGRLFFDIQPADEAAALKPYRDLLVPGHLLGRMEFDADTLRLALLGNTVAAPDSGRRHGPRLWCRTDYASSEDVLVVTPTDSLRDFLAARGGEERLFTRMEMVRVR